MPYPAAKYRDLFAAAALGDALGLPLEISGTPPRETWILDLDEFAKHAHVTRFSYSDDTELLLITTEAVVEACGFNPAVFIHRLVERAATRNPLRNYSVGLAEVIEAVRRGVDWRRAARAANYGRGVNDYSSVVRTPPIVLFYELRESVELMSVAQAMVTHVNRVSVEAARLYAIALYELLHGADPQSIPDLLRRETMLELFREKLEFIAELRGRNPQHVVKVLGSGSSAPEAVLTALYAFVMSDGDAGKAIGYSLSMGGCAGTRAFLAAALAAATRGVDEHLLRLFRRVENSEAILRIADKLYRASVTCHAVTL